MDVRKDPAVVVGLGEMGSVFSRAFLRAGHPVYPVLRGVDPDTVAAAVPRPHLVLVAVGEADLAEVLAALPTPWRSRLLLIQNELVPSHWRRHGIDAPTVAPVWFEKKPGRDVKVIVPTPVAGPRAEFVVAALGGIGIPAEVVPPAALEQRLVAKNLYILVSNLGGLAVGGGTVGELWANHRPLVEAIARDVLALQRALVDGDVDEEAAIAEMVAAFTADPEHGAMGRSAPARLARALDQADRLGIDVPTLRSIPPSPASNA